MSGTDSVPARKELMVSRSKLLQQFPRHASDPDRLTGVLFCRRGLVLFGGSHCDIHVYLATQKTPLEMGRIY